MCVALEEYTIISEWNRFPNRLSLTYYIQLIFSWYFFSSLFLMNEIYVVRHERNNELCCILLFSFFFVFVFGIYTSSLMQTNIEHINCLYDMFSIIMSIYIDFRRTKVAVVCWVFFFSVGCMSVSSIRSYSMGSEKKTLFPLRLVKFSAGWREKKDFHWKIHFFICSNSPFDSIHKKNQNGVVF